METAMVTEDCGFRSGPKGGRNAGVSFQPVVSRKRPLSNTIAEFLGQKSSGIVDPFKMSTTKRSMALDRFKKTGSPFSHTAYIAHWEEEVANVIHHFSEEKSFRKAISLIRRYRPGTTNKEAFCSLAAAEGSVTEAMGQLSNPEYRTELKLVCRLLDMDKYCSPTFASPSGDHHTMTTSNLTTVRIPLGATMATTMVTTTMGVTRGLESAKALATPQRRRLPAFNEHRAAAGKTFKPPEMDITRADLEFLFAHTTMRSSSASVSSDTAFDRPPSTLATTKSLASLPSQRARTAAAIPSRRALYALVNTTLHPRRMDDLEELRKLSATVMERSKVYSTPYNQRPFSSTAQHPQDNQLTTKFATPSSGSLWDTSGFGLAGGFSTEL